MNMRTYGKLRVELMKARFVAGARMAGRGAYLMGQGMVRDVGELEQEVRAAESKLGIGRQPASPPARQQGGKLTAKRLREMMERCEVDKWQRICRATDGHRANAIHEAGHVVAAFALGARVTFVTSESEAYGMARIDAVECGIVQRAAIAVAGAVAERIVAGRQDAKPSEADTLAWTEGLRRCDFTQCLRDGTEEAERIVTRHGAAIGDLANELLGRGFLTDEQLDPWRSRIV